MRAKALVMIPNGKKPDWDWLSLASAATRSCAIGGNARCARHFGSRGTNCPNAWISSCYRDPKQHPRSANCKHRCRIFAVDSSVNCKHWIPSEANLEISLAGKYGFTEQDVDHAGPSVPKNHQPHAWSSLPISAELQCLFYPLRAAIWGSARGLA